MEYSIVFVSLMGMGTVFVGLICLIILTGLLGRIVGGTKKEPISDSVSTPAAEPDAIGPELIAAISAAIAEELGTDITGIRILSIRKL